MWLGRRGTSHKEKGEEGRERGRREAGGGREGEAGGGEEGEKGEEGRE